MLLRRLLVTVLLTLALPAIALAASGGRVLLVGPGKPSALRFATIQAAVNASMAGDTIRVGAGTYNESVVIAGKQRLTLLGGSPESTLVVGTFRHAIEIKATGLATIVDDDTQNLPVGTSRPNSDCVRTGSDGDLDTSAAVGDDVLIPVTKIISGLDAICNTTAAPGDEQAIPVGQPEPNSSCVGPGPNGTFQTTPAGDDVQTTTPIVEINSGPDGICNTTAVSTDDVVDTDANKINSGEDGVCNTSANMSVTPPDTQPIDVGRGDPDTDCVLPGPNAVLDTTNSIGDEIVGTKITSGLNGICESTAAGDDVQAIPVGQGKANGGCVAGGASITRSRDVKVQNFTLRATNGFDGVNVSRADFVTLTLLVLDAQTYVFKGACTGPGTPYTCCTGAGAGKCAPINACTAANVPFTCCTGKGTGNCDSNDTCTAAGAPLSCCTGSGTGDCVEATGNNGIFVDATAVKPTIKSCTAKRQRVSGFFVEGPGAEVTSCRAESNNEYGFAQFQSSDSAVYTGNVSLGNDVGFGLAGQVNIIQRCTAQQNASAGFDIFGVGNILFQVVASMNGPATTSGIGIRSVGRGTRIRSSIIQGNTGSGIVLTRDMSFPFPDPNITSEGSEIFANTIQSNGNVGIDDDVFGVVIRQNIIGPVAANRQDVGVLLRDEAQGTLLEGNRIVNNRDTNGGVCAANALCDLVNQGLHNAGKTNQFSPGFTPPPGFQ